MARRKRKEKRSVPEVGPFDIFAPASREFSIVVESEEFGTERFSGAWPPGAQYDFQVLNETTRLMPAAEGVDPEVLKGIASLCVAFAELNISVTGLPDRFPPGFDWSTYPGPDSSYPLQVHKALTEARSEYLERLKKNKQPCRDPGPAQRRKPPEPVPDSSPALQARRVTRPGTVAETGAPPTE